MTQRDLQILKEVLCPHDNDYSFPCIAPEYLEEELNELFMELNEDALKEPKVLTLEELEALPRLSIVWIEYWDGELQGPGKTLLAGMKCYDGTVVDEDASSYSDFQRDMTPDYDGSRWRFWLGKPTEEQRKAVKWDG